MTTRDWLNIGLTMVTVFALLSLARYWKSRHVLPVLPLWPLYLGYNAFWGLLLLLDRAGVLPLPVFVGPIALIGGNGVLLLLYGLPILPAALGPRRRSAAKRAGAPSDPNRARIVPERKKKRRKRRD